MKVFKFLKNENDLTVLVSGGIDSISVTHWLKFVFRKNIRALHFNHHVQQANDLMESGVIAFCEAFNIPLTVIHRTDSQTKLGEAQMRDWRISELTKIGGQKKYISGHHLNDACENYVSNCMTGNPEYKPIAEQTDFGKFQILHPFLLTPKRDMVKYVKDNNLQQFVTEDPTNKSNIYRRNSIRNQIIPLMNEWSNLETIVRKKFYNQ